MRPAKDHDTPDRRPRPLWADRVAVSESGAPFAFVPGHVLVRGERAQERVRSLTGLEPEERADQRSDREAPLWVRVTGVADPLALVGVLRSEGLDAQPEHVFFSHGCGGGCEDGPHPAYHYAVASGEWGADPYKANPYKANPYKANPYKANPYKANPYKANPYKANEPPLSTAEPAPGPSLPARPALHGPGAHPRVVVLDTGLAGGRDDNGATNADGQRPALLDVPGPPERISGVLDRPDDEIGSVQGFTFPPDDYLDPVAGHGTFIAGLIEQIAGGCEIRVERVISPLGDARELDVAMAIEAEAGRPEGERPDILVMSFGGPVLEQAPALRTAVASARLAGIVLVASAGNDGVCVPQYPAAFDEVVAVAAVGPYGPPPWTNYGEWVDACAPGVELVSAFFKDFNGDFPMMNSVDIDDFAEWAQWSGTSFAAPVVVAALAREMVVGDCGAADAVRRVLHAPHLLRLPCLGTVVNL